LNSAGPKFDAIDSGLMAPVRIILPRTVISDFTHSAGFIRRMRIVRYRAHLLFFSGDFKRSRRSTLILVPRNYTELGPFSRIYFKG